jgi:putative redox protein
LINDLLENMATSKIVYLGELRTTAQHVASQKEIITDAPVDNHGKGEAFSPTDLTATSLGNCIMTIMGIYAQNHGVDLVGTELFVTKFMSKEPPRKISEIHVRIEFVNKDIPENNKKALQNAAHTCPVALSLHPDIKQIVEFVW